MGITLPLRIYDTNLVANRKWDIPEFRNRVLQQYRPLEVGRILSLLNGRYWSKRT
jgi:hypothetical protein